MKPSRKTLRAGRATQGFMLEELLVYIGVLAILLGFGYFALYRLLDNSAALQHHTADISNALHAGEQWRADVRAVTGTPRVEVTAANEQVLHLPTGPGEVTYKFSDDTVFRCLGNNAWTPLLANVKASAMKPDPRRRVAAWRWEIELQPHRKTLTRMHPLFTFVAAPALSSAK